MSGGRGERKVTGEAEIIACLAPLTARFPGAFALSDDCAAFAPEPGCEIVLNTDAVAEGVHFLPDDRAADIAWKALAVNVSDLAAKAARPRIFLMALAFPDAPEREWIADFARGLAEAQQRFGIELAGGDTDRRPGPLSVTITALGEAPAGRMVRRGAARPGDVLYVSGTLGDAALGLRLRTKPGAAGGWRLSTEQVEALVARYRRPEPRVALRDTLRTHARAAMDLSDGLAKDLGRMAKASACGARVSLPKLPQSTAMEAVAIVDAASAMAARLSGGDDYEVLAAVDPSAAADFEQSSARCGVRVTAIGNMTREPEVLFLDDEGRPITVTHAGWDHF